MDGVPNNAAEVYQFINDVALAEIELGPGEKQQLGRYMRERHESLYGPYPTYFVLGSYERPFKFRLEIAATELNQRDDAYAYLLAPQPDPDVPSDDSFPSLKVKYYIHALYADFIVLVLEHNEGGALTEMGRSNVETFFGRTHLLPRGWGIEGPEVIEVTEDARRAAVKSAYDAEDDDELAAAIDLIVDRADDASLPLTTADLRELLEEGFEGHLAPRYSGVLIDEFDHYARVDRCYPWLSEAQLRENVDEIP